MASAVRTIIVEFVAGPLDGWRSEQTHDRPVTLPEALDAEDGFYALEIWGPPRHYKYRWHEGAP